MEIVLNWIENILRKGENDGYWHFLLFQQYFEKVSNSNWLKLKIVWSRVKGTYKHVIKNPKRPISSQVQTTTVQKCI